MGVSRHLLKSKIHRALITDANLNYNRMGEDTSSKYNKWH
jgi:hypothetical protein